MRTALVLAATIALQAPQAAEQIRVDAYTDRPAMWVADRLTYTIEIVCPRGVDVIAADLDRAKLPLDGLEIVDADTHKRQDAGVTTYRFDYVLTTYRTDRSAASVGSFRVRYYLTRAGQRAEEAEAAPAGVVAVPAVTIPFRSLLPDDQTTSEVRDARPVPPRWTVYRALAPAGVALILVSMTPVLFLIGQAADRVRERRRAGPKTTTRQARADALAQLEALRAIDAADPAARRQAFAQVDALVRDRLARVAGIRAAGLTPEEILAAVDHHSAPLPPELLRTVLECCDAARYAAPALQPSAEAWRDALEKAEEIVTGVKPRS
jgi:hypothetical protein